MYHKTVLNQGIRVVSEEITQVRSVSIGVWILCGSRHEDERQQGISHFVEHMLFKGTSDRTAYDIAAAIDSVGGIMNAFTGKELSSIYIKVPDYHLTTAIELLADMLGNSVFATEEVEREKGVVIEEIHQLYDAPDDYVHDLIESAVWDGQALGRSVLGRETSVVKLTGDDLRQYLNSRYRGKNLIISATGNVKHDVLVTLINEAFGSLGFAEETPQDRTPKPYPKVVVVEKELEQVHLVMGTVAPSAVSEKRFACFLMNVMLGGCMSSRLFQEIRERRGLAYAIHSYLTSYQDLGLFGIYAGINEEKVREVVSVILEELHTLAVKEVSQRELNAAKELIKGNFLLSMESTDYRMTRLAKNEVCFGRNITIEDFIQQIDAVSAGDIRCLAAEMFERDGISWAAIGPVEKKDLLGP